jgi:putative transposase
MPIGLERRQKTDQLHFITFSCHQRLPYLKDPEPKSSLKQVIERTRRSHNLTIYAYVLMPEHVHLLTNEPTTDTLAIFLQIFRQLTSSELRPPNQKTLGI